jgi:hypothetical protein
LGFFQTHDTPESEELFEKQKKSFLVPVLVHQESSSQPTYPPPVAYLLSMWVRRMFAQFLSTLGRNPPRDPPLGHRRREKPQKNTIDGHHLAAFASSASRDVLGTLRFRVYVDGCG